MWVRSGMRRQAAGHKGTYLSAKMAVNTWYPQALVLSHLSAESLIIGVT